MRFLILTIAWFAMSFSAWGYGGEEVPNGNPWHHYDITRRAAAGDVCFFARSVSTGTFPAPMRCASGDEVAGVNSAGETYLARAPGGDKYAPGVIRQLYKGAGFTRDAALTLAWHADWVDSYLYNPLWWAQAADFKRAIVASATYEELAKVHFDDSFSTGAIQDAWTRYSSGAVIALNWAAAEWGPVKGRINELSRTLDEGGASLSAAARADLESRLQDARREERDILQAGFNVVGISMHALQDFYSHTTWLNEEDLRRTTWFEMSPRDRGRLNLMAGAYEEPISAAPIHHGDFAFACSFFRRNAVEKLMKPACSTLSPAQNMKMCDMHRKCKGAEAAEIRTYGAEFGNLIYLNPVGVNLDNTIYAGFGGELRGILGEDQRFRPGQRRGWIARDLCPSIINRKSGDGRIDCINGNEAHARRLFATSKDLAIRASTQWLLLLEQELNNTGAGAFWSAMKNHRHESGEQASRERQYESYRRFPYQFMTAGPYPGNTYDSSNGYYLRLDIETSNVRRAGTSADIIVKAGGKEFLLDYLPTAYDEETGEGRVSTIQRAFTHNDFERGDRAVYTIGPFTSLPASIEIHNDDANARDVLKGLRREIRDAFKRAGFRFRDAALSIIGGHADHVDTQIVFWERERLEQIIRNGGVAVLTFDGGKEGLFEYDIRVERTSWRGSGFYKDWGEYRVSVGEMRCIKESDRDRGSNSDEIFSLWTLSRISEDQKQSFRTRVFNDVDKGEARQIDMTFHPVRLPPFGGVVLGGQTLESDSERSSDRNRLLREFATGVEQEVAPRRGRFLDAMGKAVAPDWRPRRIKIYAFKRGPRPEVGWVFNQDIDRWLNGGQTLPITLNRSMRPLRTSPSLLQWTGEDVTLYNILPEGIRDRVKDELPPPVIKPEGPRLPGGRSLPLPDAKKKKK